MLYIILEVNAKRVVRIFIFNSKVYREILLSKAVVTIINVSVVILL
jgi:hypothetical protein